MMPDPAYRVPSRQEAELSRVAFLRGNKAFLRPLLPTDYDHLYLAELTGELGMFRHQGRTPPPESYPQSLWAAVLCQYIIGSVDDLAPIGLVTAYKADYRNGHAYLAGMSFKHARNTTASAEGFEMFVEHLFSAFPFRKIYAEVLEPNLTQFDSLVGDLFVEEGRLRDFLFIGGRYVDMLTLTLNREAWASRRRLSSGRLNAFLREREARHGE